VEALAVTAGPETRLVRRIRDRLRILLGEEMWECKLAGGPYQKIGLPDLIVVYGGRLLALEVKCPQPGETAVHARGRVTDQQAKCLADLHRAGAYADVVISVEEAERAARKAFNLGEGEE
jgi:hypothetical protein